MLLKLDSMKSLSYFGITLLTVLMSVAISGCSKSDDNNGDPPIDLSSVIGRWKCTSSTDSWDGGSKTGYMINVILTIKEDGRYESTSKDMGLKGTWNLSNNTLTAISDKNRVFTATVSVNSTTLIIKGTTNDGYVFDYTFTKIDNQSLKGSWVGNMHVTIDLQEIELYDPITELTFLSDPLKDSSGEGYLVFSDNYSYSNSDCVVACIIEWSVDQEGIHVVCYDFAWEFLISDYSLIDNRFRGYLNFNGKYSTFELFKTETPIYRDLFL